MYIYVIFLVNKGNSPFKLTLCNIVFLKIYVIMYIGDIFMLKKLSLIFFTLSSLSLLVANLLSALQLNLGNVVNMALTIVFWGALIAGIALIVTYILKVGSGSSGYFKKTKLIDALLLGSALLYFIATFLKVDLLVAIFFPLIIYFFELHVLFNTKD